MEGLVAVVATEFALICVSLEVRMQVELLVERPVTFLTGEG